MPDFVHEYIQPAGATRTTILVLHGTGGDEHDLLPLAQQMAPGAGLLSPRGKVLENGMPRFFRRLAMGVFDLEDLRLQTQELADFVGESALRYGFDAGRVLALGYSNGANIAASLLFSNPPVLQGGVLLRPMVPFVPDPLPLLDSKAVWIGGGRQDTMIQPDQTAELAKLLESAGAEVDLHWVPGGHQLERRELAVAGEWLSKRL